MKVLLGRYKWG